MIENYKKLDTTMTEIDLKWLKISKITENKNYWKIIENNRKYQKLPKNEKMIENNEKIFKSLKND